MCIVHIGLWNDSFKIDYTNLDPQTKLVRGKLVVAIAAKPPSTSEKFRYPLDCKIEAAIMLR